MDECVRVTKEVMREREERNNGDKEDRLDFGREEGEDVCILGSWVGDKADAKNRIWSGGWIWSRLKGWLLSKKWQAKVVQACVESIVLYDRHATVWQKRKLKEVQKWMDKCYRYMWSDRNCQPLQQMSERGVNMVDVRKVGVKSMVWKVEKRVLKRIRCVLRMNNKKLTKAIVLQWYEGLESRSKMIRKKKVLY